MNLNWNPLLFPSREVSELLHRNIDDISTQQIYFPKYRDTFVTE